MSDRARSRSPIRRDVKPDDRRKPGGERTGRFNPNSDRMVYITNLPYEMSWMELKDAIREKAGEVIFVEVLKHRDGKSKGVAIVELASKEAAAKSIDILHRQAFGGRSVSAKEIRASLQAGQKSRKDPQAFFRRIKEESGIDLLNRGAGGGGGDRRMHRPISRDRHISPGLARPSETYGLSASFLENLGLKPPLVNRVFITNISYTCGVGKLYDVFNLAGRITWIDLQLDKDGKSKGMAVVEYSHPIEAVQAVSMLNNQRLVDRTLTVKMDRFEKDPDRDRQGLPNGLRNVGMGLGAHGAPLTDIASAVSQMQPAMSAYGGANGGAMVTPMAAAPAMAANVVQMAPQAAPAYSAFAPMAAAPAVASAYQQQQQQPMMAPFEQHPQQQQQQMMSQAYALQPQQQAQMQQTPMQQAPMQHTPMHQMQATPQQQAVYAPATAQPAASPQAPAAASYYGQPPSFDAYATKATAPRTQQYGGGGGVSSGGATAAASVARPTQGGGGGGSGGYASYDQPTRVILIKNLPYDYTWDVIAQRLRQFGDFESVELVSSGVAKVRFLHVHDAERARSTLNSTMVENNMISVDYVM